MNKKPIEERAEVLQISRYIDIVDEIITDFPGLSVFKVLTFSYLKKNRGNYFKSIHSGKNKKDLLYKYLAEMTGKFDDFIGAIQYIIVSLDILILNEIIYIDNGLVYSKREKLHNNSNDFVSRAIQESYLFSERQFMKEVIRNV